MNENRPGALEAIAGTCKAPPESIPTDLVARLVTDYGDALDAIIYYGSCLRSRDPRAGLADFYLLVNDLRAAGFGPIARTAIRCLPPNVYYRQIDTTAGVRRCKYGVMTTTQFSRGARHWFSPGIWGRFAQPVAIVHARNEVVRGRVQRLLGQAVVTLLSNTLPMLADQRYGPAELFAKALALSYASELRVESTERSSDLVTHDAPEYERRVLAALAATDSETTDLAATQATDGRIDINIDAATTRRFQRHWAMRRNQGRLLSVLRLAKACFTFSDAIGYGAWKVERHTGIRVVVTPRMRRHPVFFGGLALIRVMRQRRRARDR